MSSAPRPSAFPEPVVLYVTNYCGFCRMAEALLRRIGVPFHAVDVTRDDGARAWLRGETGQRTVPQVFIRGRSIGGFQELYGLHRAGRLDELLAAAPTG